MFEILKNILGDNFDTLVDEFMSEEIPDDRLYDMNDFDEIMNGTSLHTLARQIYFGDFNPMHDYFMFDGYGNLQSYEFYSYWVDDHLELDRFTEWLIEEGYTSQEEIDEESVS